MKSILIASGFAVVITIGGIQIVHEGRQIQDLQRQVTTLNHACIPTDTGGGVIQCTQPNIIQAPPTEEK